LNLGISEDLVAEVAAQKSGRIEINSSAKNGRQFVLHSEEVQAGNVSGLEFHDHIYVAVRLKIIAQDRTEKREPADVMTAAKGTNAFRGYFNLRAFHRNVWQISQLVPCPG
jgi:hypothetical protein